MSLVPAVTAAEAGDHVATVKLVDTSGNLTGVAAVVQLPSGNVQVQVTVWGLAAGSHGIHVHGIGLCDPPGFTSAGGHFNPTGVAHGSHAGDLGNLVVGPNGIGRLTLRTDQFTLTPGALSLNDADGSALVLHAGQDDLVTNPAGNSGPRIACGVLSA